MFPINYLSGALQQSSQLQLQAAAEKSQQARRAQEKARNVAAPEGEDEHQVENPEELVAIHEEDHRSEQNRKKNHHKPDQEESEDDESPGLDLTA
jgi:hypothetical protein